MAYQWGLTKGTLRTVNVSLGGIKIQTDSPIPVDVRLDLIILLGYEAIKPVGKIVWSKPSSHGKYDVGISFETISHQCLERLDRFLKWTTLRNKLAKREKVLGQSGLEGLNAKSFESDRLRAKSRGRRKMVNRNEYNAHFGFLDSVKEEFDKVDTGVIFLINREMFYAKFWGKPTKLASALKQLLAKNFRNRDFRELMYALNIGSRRVFEVPRELIRSDFVEILKRPT